MMQLPTPQSGIILSELATMLSAIHALRLIPRRPTHERYELEALGVDVST